MRVRLMALVAGIGIAAGAQAQGFSSVSYECDQLKGSIDRDGILCTIADTGVRPALYIKVLTKATDPEPKKKRTGYMVDLMTRNFYAAGGMQVVTRSTNKAGHTIERSCSRSARFPNGMCGDWYEVAEKN